jgi:hypothetical protein
MRIRTGARKWLDIDDSDIVLDLQILCVNVTPNSSVDGDKLYAVTHKGTGYAAAILPSKRRAVSLARTLEPLVAKKPAWRGKSVTAITRNTPDSIISIIRRAYSRPEPATRPHKPSVCDHILAAAMRDDNTGICRACGAEQLGCEPDARNYVCEVCGEAEVFGAEQLVVMGEAD